MGVNLKLLVKVLLLFLMGCFFDLHAQEADDFLEDEINFIDEDGAEDNLEEDVVETEAMNPVEEDIERVEVENEDGFEEVNLDNDQAEPADEEMIDIENEVDQAKEMTDEEMMADYGLAEDPVIKDITDGIKIEDIVQPNTDYNFSSFGRGDPFVPPITMDVVARRGEQIVEVELKSILQKYPLLALKVAGVWQVGTLRKALITTPMNEGVVVQEGDPMGLRGGKVIDVEDDFVTVREFDLIADGTRQFQDVKVYLTGRKPKKAGKIIFTAGAEPVVIDPKAENDPPGNITPIEAAAGIGENAAVGENIQIDNQVAGDNEIEPQVEEVVE